MFWAAGRSSYSFFCERYDTQLLCLSKNARHDVRIFTQPGKHHYLVYAEHTWHRHVPHPELTGGMMATSFPS